MQIYIFSVVMFSIVIFSILATSLIHTHRSQSWFRGWPRYGDGKVDNGISGIANSFTRPRGSACEYVGACFYATATRTKTWLCRDPECNLDCSGREPVGGGLVLDRVDRQSPP